MKQIFTSLFFSAVFFQLGSVQAQESPDTQLEFIRKLRAKGYNDLALEQIEKLKKVPALVSILQLEQARTLLAMARDKEPEQRPVLFAAARTELEAFVQKNAGGPEGAQGRLEIARLAAYQGQALLTRAIREEDQNLARKAEQLFIQAGQELDVAAKALGDQAANYKDADADKEKLVKEELEKEYLKARLDRATNFIDQGMTYLNISSDAANLKRAEILDQAKQAFEAIKEDGGPAGLLATAWLIKVYQEVQDPTKSQTSYNKVMNQTGKPAQTAQRRAHLFHMQGIGKFGRLDSDKKKLTGLDKVKAVEEIGKKWLQAYPAHVKSPEGHMVRFELAEALYDQGQAAIILVKDLKDPKAPPKPAPGPPPPAAMKFFNEAQKHYAAVAESDSHLAEKANQQSVRISVLKLGDRPVSELKDFEESFLKAQVEILNMRETASEIDGKDPPKDPDKLVAKRKKHLQQAIKALQRGLNIADSKTPAQKLDEARFLLAIGYMTGGDLHRAAVAFEALGKTRPPTRRSPACAGYALQTYGDLLQRDNDEANRSRLKDMVDFILSPDNQKIFAGDPVLNVARYQLAMMHHKDDQFKEAIDLLQKLTPDFTGYVFAQSQLVFIILEARDKVKAEEEKKNYYTTMARGTILKMPPLLGDADANTGALYFYAQAEFPKILYAEAAQDLGKKDPAKAAQKYAEMGQFVAGLKGKLDQSKVKISPETREKIHANLEVLAKYARLGLAEIDYRNGKYDDVLKSTADTVGKIDALLGDGKAPIRMKDFQVAGEILGMALRANVQKGNIPKAKEILKYLERLKGEKDDDLEQTANVLRLLVADLQVQVKELKKANDPAKLKTTVNNFSAFLDELGKKNDKKSLELADITFLANCYSSLEQYCKAAKLYEQITPPAAVNKDQKKERERLLNKEKTKLVDKEEEALKKEKESLDKEEREVQTYWYLQVQYAKSMRLCAKDKAELAKAKGVLDRLLKHPNARQQLLADVETNYVLQDSALYGLASKGWGVFMKNPSVLGALADNPDVKAMYFDAYYNNVWCIFKLSQTDKVISAGKEKAYLKAAANLIVRLERAAAPREGWQIVGPRFLELLNQEKKLRDECEELKKAQ